MAMKKVSQANLCTPIKYLTCFYDGTLLIGINTCEPLLFFSGVISETSEAASDGSRTILRAIASVVLSARPFATQSRAC